MGQRAGLGGRSQNSTGSFFFLDSKDGVIRSGLVWPEGEVWGSHTSLNATGSKSRAEQGGAQSSIRGILLHSEGCCF